ncbi:XylR family transcriptional regulator [Vibrio rumoiensis]|uniref:XylR family transcriptional regulator n=1 Tax=Vibrio rumoiensis TaxID=76258 RepID=A0ABW7IYL0_9VIBR|nr:DNA-binding transcriptional regulator [Vibrio rumoiensis]
MDKKYRIALLFNANKVYDRQVIEGIGEYIQASQCDWDVFLEDDFTTNMNNFHNWQGDGVIADFDNLEVISQLSDIQIPVVGVGGSYQSDEDYPSVPYVATDNHAIVDMAFQHLKNKGIESFAFYGLPASFPLGWAHERRKAFNQILESEGYPYSTYLGNETTPQTWQYDMNRLSDWLQMLPAGTGIIAVTDARARHLLQACDHLNIMVPDRISVIGIDNEELARYLTRVSLSSVGQGCKSMGHKAARMLHRLIEKQSTETTGVSSRVVKHARVLVPPTKVYQRQSTDFQALKDPFVIQAMHFIRQHACKGIKVEQVLDYVGISRSNMETRFKDERGHSLHQEIHNSKLERAGSLLQSTELPISEIAELCGYPSLQYMYSVFKKTFDKTPKEYRLERSQDIECGDDF